MTRIHRTGALTAVATALIVALAGCVGPTPTPAPTTDAASPRPTATATPTAEPVDPLTTVTTLVARPEALELRNADGVVVASLDYLSDPAAAVAALTTVFGGAPVDEDDDGSNHFPPSTAHRWDQLLTLPGLQENPSGCSGPYLDFIEQQRVTPDGDPYLLRVSVAFNATADQTTIGSISAPMPVFDGCA